MSSAFRLLQSLSEFLSVCKQEKYFHSDLLETNREA